MTGSPYIFDPQAPRDRRVIRTKSRSWHRTIDPGVDQGGGIPADPLVVGDLVRLYVELKDSIDTTAPGGPETVAIIERSIALLVANLPLGPDRPGTPQGGSGGQIGEIVGY